MEGLERKFPVPNRVVGSETEEFDKANMAVNILKNQVVEDFEREKNSAEELVFLEIFKKIEKFIQEYGASQINFVSLVQVHILDEEKTGFKEVERFLEEGIKGRYKPGSGRIEILPRDEGLLHTAHVLVHELMHLNSFWSTTVKSDKKGGETVSPRRTGFAVFEKEDGETPAFFKFLNEAIIEELTKRFCERYFKDISIISGEDAERKKQNGKEINTEDPLFEVFMEASEERPLYAFYNERIHFIAMVKEIYKLNLDEFESYEDVFKVFSTAMFTGRILEVARLIEKSFGKGSFRKIGEKFKNMPPSVLKAVSDAEERGELK